MNDRAQFIINPEGEVVEATVKITKTRKLIKDLKEGDGGVEILGTVVQVFEPRFYEVCPECGKRARPSEGNFMCNTHNAVAPNFSYVLNAVIDDGTETIRAAFFREGVEKLLNKKPEDLLMMKEDPSKFLESRDGIQGKIIKVEGRVIKNEMFDRIEFVANEVDVNPNPEEELKRLEVKMSIYHKFIAFIEFWIGLAFLIILLNYIPVLNIIGGFVGKLLGFLNIIPYYQVVVAILGTVLFLDGLFKLIKH